MPNPLPSDVHVNAMLTNISVAFTQKADVFVADKVFPAIPVQKQSDRYFTYYRSDLNRNAMRERAPGTESAGTGWRVDNTPNYYCDYYAAHKDIDDQLRANADSPLDMDRDSTNILSNSALINKEVQWASSYFATGIWKGIDGTLGDVTGVSASPSGNQVLQWNDSNATPVIDVKTYCDDVHLSSTVRPNKLVMGRQVWSKLSEHGTITDRIKYGASPGAPAIITKQAVAALMEIDEILVMDAVKNTGAESNSATLNAGESNAFIGGKSALLVYAAPAAGIMTPSAGYTFNWVGLFGAGSSGQRISKFRMEHLKSDRIEIEQNFTQKVVAPEAAVFFATIVV